MNKKRDKRSPDFTKKAQKVQYGLMYKTKEVEPKPKGTSNTLEVLLNLMVAFVV